MRITEAVTKYGVALAAAVILGGCAFGQTYSYADAPMALQSVSSSGPVAVAVHDQRPYVTSGNKQPQFVGLMRGGFGNPFDVNTKSGGPLADELRDSIVKAMRDRGIAAAPASVSFRDNASAARSAVTKSGARRAALVTLREWKTDSMMNSSVLYDATLQVFDASGKELASSSVKGTDAVAGGLTPDVDGMRAASAKRLGQLFDDPKIVAALK